MKYPLLGLSLASTLFSLVLAGLPDRKIYGVNLGSWWAHLSFFKLSYLHFDSFGDLGLCSSPGCFLKVWTLVALGQVLLLMVSWSRMDGNGWTDMSKLPRLYFNRIVSRIYSEYSTIGFASHTHIVHSPKSIPRPPLMKNLHNTGILGSPNPMSINSNN